MRALQIALGLLLIVPALHAGDAFSVQLRSLQGSVSKGDVPRFELRVTNISDRAHRIMRLDKREDWQQAFARVTVTQDGKPVTVTEIICDPGVVTDDDDMLLAPGKSLVILLKYFAQQFDELPEGKYKAYVDYDPAEIHGEKSIRSNSVPFEVVSKKMANQSSEPTFSSVTPPAGQESRPR